MSGSNLKLAAIGLGVIAILYPVSKAMETRDRPAPQPAANQPAAKRCQSAAGNINDGLILYRDSSCKQAIGSITGIGKTPSGQKTVFVDGQQMDRETVKQWYVVN